MKNAIFPLCSVAVLATATSAWADVRVIHASPDAPAVDVYVNGIPGADDPVIQDLLFTQATDYVPLPSASYNFQVTPANSITPVVINATAEIDSSQDYSVVAVDFLASIEPLVLLDDNTINPDFARIRFVHASPDAPTVDVFAVGIADPLFDAVSFKGVGDYIEVPAGTYDLEVRLDSDGTLALEVPGVAVNAGTVYTIFAMGALAPGQPPLQAVPLVDAVISARLANVRVVHASPDAPAVDLYVDRTPGVDQPNLEDLPFTSATPYLPFASNNYNFQVTPANAIDPVVINATAFIDGALDYSIVAVNFLAEIQPLILVDDRSTSPFDARIRFVHASPDAPTVDVFAAGIADPLFDAVSFTESGGYISVPAGTYDLEVRLDDGGGLALSVPGVMVETGTVYTIFAMGSAAMDAMEPLQAVPFVDNVIAPDTNDDGTVDVADLITVLLGWGTCPDSAKPCRADTTSDGVVDMLDVMSIILNWE